MTRAAGEVKGGAAFKDLELTTDHTNHTNRNQTTHRLEFPCLWGLWVIKKAALGRAALKRQNTGYERLPGKADCRVKGDDRENARIIAQFLAVKRNVHLTNEEVETKIR
jgi:hypothetical protein